MTQERWQRLSPYEQLRNIAAEIERARVSEEQDAALFRASLERALELIDCSLADPRWRYDSLKLLVLRAEAAKLYAGEKTADITALSRMF